MNENDINTLLEDKDCPNCTELKHAWFELRDRYMAARNRNVDLIKHLKKLKKELKKNEQSNT